MSSPDALVRSIESTRPDPYPYFVLRHMPTVYSRGTFDVPETHRDAEGNLTDEGREACVQRVLAISRRNQKSVCAVFGPDDAVYVESDGSRKPSQPGGGVPDGYTHIPVGRPDEEDPPRSTWRDYFARADRSANIWSVRGDLRLLRQALQELDVPCSTSIGGSPGGAGGTDVSAWAFLDGGLQWATRDGFVCGEVYGVKVLGERAFVWCCRQLSVAPPRACRNFEGLLARLTLQVSDRETLEARGFELARARTWANLNEVAATLARDFEAWDAETVG